MSSHSVSKGFTGGVDESRPGECSPGERFREGMGEVQHGSGKRGLQCERSMSRLELGVGPGELKLVLLGQLIGQTGRPTKHSIIDEPKTYPILVSRIGKLKPTQKGELFGRISVQLGLAVHRFRWVNRSTTPVV